MQRDARRSIQWNYLELYLERLASLNAQGSYRSFRTRQRQFYIISTAPTYRRVWASAVHHSHSLSALSCNCYVFIFVKLPGLRLVPPTGYAFAFNKNEQNLYFILRYFPCRLDSPNLYEIWLQHKPATNRIEVEDIKVANVPTRANLVRCQADDYSFVINEENWIDRRQW